MLGLAAQRRELPVLGSPLNDISPLANLTNLVELKLQNNDIGDVSALAGLTNLRVLHLEFNRIEDASPLVAIDHPDLFINLDKNDLTEESIALMKGDAGDRASRRATRPRWGACSVNSASWETGDNLGSHQEGF